MFKSDKKNTLFLRLVFEYKNKDDNIHKKRSSVKDFQTNENSLMLIFYIILRF